MSVPRIRVDLGDPPSERWRALAPFVREAREMTESYLKDLGDSALWASLVDAYRMAFVPPDIGAEVEAIAAMIDKTPGEVLIANLYYDAFRAIIGCTAFAVETPSGPLHARNLDWWTERNILSKHTILVDVIGAPAGPYTSVGWPGFLGVFSGVAQGRFAITLNAVLSEDTPQLAPSITLTLREVFETARTFDEAVDMLTSRTIASDCLLLVTGTENAERVVVERTSTRSATRRQEGGPLVVTNDYRRLEDTGGGGASQLHATACTRFDRALYLATVGAKDPAACLAVLKDPKVKMMITVQQMVLQASTGLAEVALP